MEVSDSSLRVDQRVKLPTYARAGIPEYWVVDLRRRRILAHRDPVGEAYRTIAIHEIGDTISPPWSPDASVELRDLLP